MVVQLSNQSNTKLKGRGFLDKFIDNLPFELHIPGYKFCGPGTKLNKRLQRGDKGINALDEACKEHDIAYVNKNRNLADKILIHKAIERFKAKKLVKKFLLQVLQE